MITVATPDYLRFGVPSTFKMFKALTQYPSLQRLLELKVPTLVVIGTRDPLLPGPERIKEVASQDQNHVLLVVLEGAAHAINFSHPRELAHVIRRFMDDKPITGSPGERECSRSSAARTTRSSPRTERASLRRLRVLVLDDVVAVHQGVAHDPGALLGGQFAPDLRRHPRDERSRRDHRALEHDRAARDQAALADHGSAQHDAPMPISDPSPIVQPCTTALWPTETFSPITTGRPLSTCTDTLSCRLLPTPTVIVSPSARRTALYQTLEPSLRVTPPTTRAPAATNACRMKLRRTSGGGKY